MTSPRPTLALLDGHSLAYRAFFALPDSITDDDGRPVNAVRGYLDDLEDASILCLIGGGDKQGGGGGGPPRRVSPPGGPPAAPPAPSAGPGGYRTAIRLPASLANGDANETGPRPVAGDAARRAAMAQPSSPWGTRGRSCR